METELLPAFLKRKRPLFAASKLSSGRIGFAVRMTSMVSDLYALGGAQETCVVAAVVNLAGSYAACHIHGPAVHASLHKGVAEGMV